MRDFSKMKSCLLFLLFIKSIDSATFRCDYKFSTSLNGWLKYHNIPANWQEARLRCTLEGAMLASPTSPDMISEIAEAAHIITPNVRQIFTGLHATFSRGEFYTVDGKSMSEFNFVWDKNQPDNMNERCLTMNSKGQLSDMRCADAYPYMCFKSNDPETMTNECGTTDSEYKLDTRTNKCYKFHVVARNFSRAHFACSAEGGHLAIINSDLESQVLRDVFAKYPGHTMVGNFWKDAAYIGFHNWGEDTDWRTIEGQTLKEAGFAIFSGGQPDNAAPGEQCGSIFRNGLLNDLWCEKVHPFICEKDPRFPKVCSDVTSEHSSSSGIVETYSKT